MARFKNSNWIVEAHPNNPKIGLNCEEARLAVLMDIRDELQALNRIMQCHNVASGFCALAKIARRDEQAFERRVAAAARKRANRAAQKARK